ncbi:MAG TPA: LD-carboxypeptidase [Bacteroidales bacterium]|nr:LD-carboxypeptidase [Bacteroidales bacterium]
MITPGFLKKGDKIGIVAPARKILMPEIKASIKVFEAWGLKVELSKNLFAENKQFAGTEQQRAEDMQYMLDNPEIKAIICARGGYGTIKILELLDFSQFIKNPKWIVGYSDITALHALINNQFGVNTLHATMPLNFPTDGSENDAVKSLKNVLFGNNIQYRTEPHEFNRAGKAEGELIGGNLSVLYSIAGTKFDLDTNGKILILEDLDEYLYHIDRMMMNLKYSGKLENLKALLIGGMTEMKDNTVPFGKSAYEIIRDAVSEYSYPVCYDFPVGHLENNLTVVLGQNAEIEIEKSYCSFSQKLL